MAKNDGQAMLEGADDALIDEIDKHPEMEDAALQELDCMKGTADPEELPPLKKGGAASTVDSVAAASLPRYHSPEMAQYAVPGGFSTGERMNSDPGTRPEQYLEQAAGCSDDTIQDGTISLHVNKVNAVDPESIVKADASGSPECNDHVQPFEDSEDRMLKQREENATRAAHIITAGCSGLVSADLGVATTKDDKILAQEHVEPDRSGQLGQGSRQSSRKTSQASVPEHPVRRMFFDVVTADWFDKLILFFICITCIQLALTDPTDKSTTSTRAQINSVCDWVLLIVFTVEMIMKLIALGLLTYWYDGWNCLDGVVVIMGYVTMAPGMADLVVMRLLRVFRPLRIINKLEGMKAIVRTLAMSAAGLRDTCVLCIIIFFLFGIVGDTLFGGVLRQKCFMNSTNGWIEDTSIERMCGGEFSCPTSHRCMFVAKSPNFGLTSFDNIGTGFLTIFVAITLEAWVDVMYQVQDGYQYWVATIYFHLLVIIGSLFAVNLALAVISDSFDRSLDVGADDDQTEEEIEAAIEEDVVQGMLGVEGRLPMSTIAIIRRQKKSQRQNLLAKTRAAEKQGGDVKTRMYEACRNRASAIAYAQWFQNFVLVAILANTVTLSLEHKKTVDVEIALDGVVYQQQRAGDMSDASQDVLEYMNYVFIVIYTLEVVIKGIALGLRDYWADSFNRFDAIVVIMSYVELTAASGGSVSALRAFRLMRIFKVARRWKSMQTILGCILHTLPSMGYLCILLLLFMFIMAVAGMFLFGGKFQPPDLSDSPRANFDTFGAGMLSVFQVLTGENWNEILYDGIEAGGYFTVVYFLILVVIGNFIVLNLTLAILLSNFDEGDYGENDMLSLDDIKTFFGCGKCGKSAVVPVDEKYGASPGAGEVEQLKQQVNSIEASIVRRPGRTLTRSQRRRSSHLQANLYLLAEAEQRARQQQELERTNVGSESCSGKGSGSGDPDTQDAIALYADDVTAPADDTNGITHSKITPPIQLSHDAELSLKPCLSLNAKTTKGGDSKSLVDNIDFDECDPPTTVVDADKDVSLMGHALKSMLGGVQRMTESQLVGYCFHQMHLNWKFSDEKLECSVLHTSMAVAVQQYRDSERRKRAEHNSKRDCTGMVPGQAPVLTERSLYILGPTNSFRLVVSKIVVHPIFETSILFLICASSVTLAMDGPEATDGLRDVLQILDVFFTVIFALEMVLKCVVYGFIQPKIAYLKDGWNVLDSFIVTVSIMSVIVGDKIESFRSLRTLRALRPLRTIKRFPGLRCVVEAILRCIPPFVNILMVSTVFYLVFAIMGVQFWAGKFWHCNDGSVSGADHCVGTFLLEGMNTTRVWKNAPINFDDVTHGMLSLFEVASLELWLDVMYSAMDVPAEINQQPTQNRSWYFAIYFVTFVVIGSFLILNLFVGAVVDTFTSVKNEQNRIATMTDAQAEFVSSLRSMIVKRPTAVMRPPEGTGLTARLRMLCFAIVQFDFSGTHTGAVFDAVVIQLICINILVMSAVQWQTPPSGSEADSQAVIDAQRGTSNLVIENINLVFSCIFSIEALLKILGLGRQYFKSTMNLFDLFVVTISAIGDVLERSIETDVEIFGVLLIFRAARVMRILRLFTRFRGVQRLLETLLFTLPSLLNVTLLLVMILFMYTIVGMNFFGKMQLCPNGPCPYGLYNEHANFKYFHIGFFTLFRMSTGESWNGIMHDCMAQYGWGAATFFVSYMFVGASLMFNLVIAILLDEFSSMGASDHYEITPDNVGEFAQAWQDLDPSATFQIPCKKLPVLLRMVQPPLGVGKDASPAEAHLMLLKVNAPLHQGQAHFVETFVALVRFAYKVDHLDQELYKQVVGQLNLRFPTLDTTIDGVVTAYRDSANSRQQKQPEGSMKVIEVDGTETKLSAANNEVMVETLASEITANEIFDERKILTPIIQDAE